jgi:hypothetical protein
VLLQSRLGGRALIPLTAKVRRIAPPEIKLRLLNSIIRDALYQTGVKWVTDDLPKHFEQGAYQRYGYDARNTRYNAIKRRMLRVRTWRHGRTGGNWIPAPKPPSPLRWTDNLKDSLLRRSPADFNIKATSTSNKHTVRVPCPLPHPMSAQNANELVRLNQEEFEALQQYAFNLIQQRLESIRDVVEYEIGAAA